MTHKGVHPKTRPDHRRVASGAKIRDAMMDQPIVERDVWFEQLLRVRERVLLEEVHALRIRPFDPEIKPPLPRDVGDESIASMIDLRVLDVYRALVELRAIDAALRRIANGTYSRCTDCGKDLTYARLRAQPVLQRRGECQRHHEHR